MVNPFVGEYWIIENRLTNKREIAKFVKYSFDECSSDDAWLLIGKKVPILWDKNIDPIEPVQGDIQLELF